MSDAATLSSSDSDSPAAGTATEAPASSPAAPDAPSPSSGNDGPDAASSTDTVSDRDGLLAAVKDAVAPKDPDDAPVAPKDTPAVATVADSKPAATPAPADPEADPTERELAGYKPNARRYISRLTAQRREAREALDAVQPELNAHRQLTGYLQQHQLAAEDVNLLLGVGAALRRGDYQAFLDGIEPYRQVARQSLGLDVSPDLRTQVDDGAMTEEAAREMTRTRLAAARHRVEAEVQTQRHTERDTQAHVAQVRQAVEGWEAGVRARDPDYALKETLVRRASQALLGELGTPRTPHDAVSLVQRAYDEVTSSFARARPAPQATRHTPSGVSTSSLGAAAEPRNLMEAVRLGLARTQRSL